MFSTLAHWLDQNSLLLGIAVASSIFLLVASIFATPWIVSKLPEDYFLQCKPRSKPHSVISLIIDIIRTCIGVTLALLGVIMLVIPGPGLVTLLAGLSLARFPGKQRLIRNIAGRKSVFASLNWMRKRHGSTPLLNPHHH